MALEFAEGTGVGSVCAHGFEASSALDVGAFADNVLCCLEGFVAVCEGSHQDEPFVFILCFFDEAGMDGEQNVMVSFVEASGFGEGF